MIPGSPTSARSCAASSWPVCRAPRHPPGRTPGPGQRRLRRLGDIRNRDDRQHEHRRQQAEPPVQADHEGHVADVAQHDRRDAGQHLVSAAQDAPVPALGELGQVQPGQNADRAADERARPAVISSVPSDGVLQAAAGAGGVAWSERSTGSAAQRGSTIPPASQSVGRDHGRQATKHATQNAALATSCAAGTSATRSRRLATASPAAGDRCRDEPFAALAALISTAPGRPAARSRRPGGPAAAQPRWSPA